VNRCATQKEKAGRSSSGSANRKSSAVAIKSRGATMNQLRLRPAKSKAAPAVEKPDRKAYLKLSI